VADRCLFQKSRVTGARGGGEMAMTRMYSRVTHRPAALIYDNNGKLSLLVMAPPLGVFAGQRLPRNVAQVFGAEITVVSPKADDRPTDHSGK
jgi:hypothetical protein